MAKWQTLSTRVAYENPFTRVHEDQVINPLGKQTVYGWIESTSGSVYVVPVDEDGNTYLIRQYRYPIQQAVWECVAGRVDGESPEVAAGREVLEETGVKAESITRIGELYMADGIATFKMAVCIARGLTQVTDEVGVDEEILEVRKLPLSEAIEQIMAGTVQCGPSVAALFMAKTYLEKETA